MTPQALFHIHLFVTLFLTGLIWFVQLVHYPLFKAIPFEEFQAYEQKHIKRTTALTFPLMLVELGTGLGLYLLEGNTIFPPNSLQLNLASIACLWGSTFLLQVPLHRKMEREPRPNHIDLLIKSNWFRTMLWSCRSMFLFILLPLSA